jgi:hypothetical protein
MTDEILLNQTEELSNLHTDYQDFLREVATLLSELSNKKFTLSRFKTIPVFNEFNEDQKNKYCIFIGYILNANTGEEIPILLTLGRKEGSLTVQSQEIGNNQYIAAQENNTEFSIASVDGMDLSFDHLDLVSVSKGLIPLYAHDSPIKKHFVVLEKIKLLQIVPFEVVKGLIMAGITSTEGLLGINPEIIRKVRSKLEFTRNLKDSVDMVVYLLANISTKNEA